MFPDYLVQKIAQAGSTLDSIDTFRQCADENVLPEVKSELYDFIVAFMKALEEQREQVWVQREQECLQKEQAAREQQRDNQTRRRKNLCDALDDAMKLVSLWS